MKVIGHPLISSPNFSHISNQEQIDHTLANCVVWWKCDQDLDLSLAHFCQMHQITYAVHIHSIKDLIFYANLGATYLIATQEHIQTFQSIVKEYLFDCILLCIIQHEEEIEELATIGIDGIIFDSHLLKA